MKLVTLMENTACREDLHYEHGLSLYIEACGRRILFDAGQSGAFAENARALGVDLGQVDFAVLSHGHYDHGGGLSRFLALNSAAKVYANQYAFGQHYNASDKYIGLDQAMDTSRFVFTQGEQTLAPGITLHTIAALPRETSGLQRMAQGQLVPEDFRHEQYLLMEENGRRILFSGCSHKGIVQIAEHFRPDVLVGGFHLMKTGDEKQLQATAQALLALPTTYYTGHCTGQAQYDFLKQIMKGRLHYLSAGTVLEV